MVKKNLENNYTNISFYTEAITLEFGYRRTICALYLLLYFITATKQNTAVKRKTLKNSNKT